MNRFTYWLASVSIAFGLILGLQNCRKDDEAPPKSSEKLITGFLFTDLSPAVSATINNQRLFATVSANTDWTKLIPTITISPKATVSPASGVVQDFSRDVVYTVTAEDGSQQQYTVTVSREKSTAKLITKFTFAALTPPFDATINEAAKVISGTLPATADLAALVPTITTSERASVSPASGVAQNFSQDVTYTVTAEDGTTQRYTVRLSKELPPLDPPTLTIQNASGISSVSALLAGSITKLSNRSIVSYGFALSDTDPNPRAGAPGTLTAGSVAPTTVPFGFQSRAANLRANTVYYYRGFINVQLDNASPSARPLYIETEVRSFTTLAETGTSGTWAIRSDLGTQSLRSFDFFYNGTFYDVGSKDIATYTIADRRYTNSSGPVFPGTGNMGESYLIGSKLYVLMSGTSITTPTKEVWEYDLDAKRWTRKADFPGIGRADGVGVVQENKLYFGTGNEYTTRPKIATQLRDWYEYEPATNQWAQKANLTLTANSMSGFAPASGNVILGFGFSNSVITQWFSYFPSTDRWSTLVNPTGDVVSPFQGTPFPGIYAGSNYLLLLNSARTAYSMWSWGQSSGGAVYVWTRRAQLPVSLSGLGITTFGPTFNVNGKPLLVVTASNGTQTLYEFTP